MKEKKSVSCQKLWDNRSYKNRKEVRGIENALKQDLRILERKNCSGSGSGQSGQVPVEGNFSTIQES